MPNSCETRSLAAQFASEMMKTILKYSQFGVQMMKNLVSWPLSKLELRSLNVMARNSKLQLPARRGRWLAGIVVLQISMVVVQISMVVVRFSMVVLQTRG